MIDPHIIWQFYLILVPRPSVKSPIKLILPKELCLPKGENYLLWDSGVEEKRIIMLATDDSLKWLNNSLWSVDGTFASAPAIFYQLFTFHTHRRNTALPCLFVLLHGKSEEIYLRMLEALNHLRPELNPMRIISDFEKAILNSFHQIYPDGSQHGCFFISLKHFFVKFKCSDYKVITRTLKTENSLVSSVYLWPLPFCPRKKYR